MGLVNTVVPLASLESETVSWARELLDKSPLALRMLKGALNAVISSASRARGSPPSSGRIAGPLPSSAAASSSTSRGLVCSTRTACKERIVTIVKVRTLTQGGYE